MTIAQVELTNGRHTVLPDAGNWRNVSVVSIDDIRHKVGEYRGTEPVTEYTGEWPLPRDGARRTRLRPGEVIRLLPDVGYAKMSNDNALMRFLDRIKFPDSSDGLVDVKAPFIAAGLDQAIAANHLVDADKLKVLRGVRS